MLVFLNGKIVKEEDATISISDLSYQFGYGLFETIKCEHGIPLFFENHYRRLTQSAKEIGMPFPVEINEVKNWIKEVLSANKLTSARLKIIISKRAGDKFNVLILTSPLEKLPLSYSLLSRKLDRDSNSISFRHKTTSRADSYISYREAQEKKFDDVVYLNDKNEMTECTRANIFLVMDNKIITPLLESGILSGVTRNKAIEIAKKERLTVEEKNVHNLYLNKAHSVFITNAVIGIMPVSRIELEGKEYKFSQSSVVTRLRNLYDIEVKGYLENTTNLVCKSVI